MGWLAVCLALLVFGPFVGFSLSGRVDPAGLAAGAGVAALGVIGMALIAVRRWLAWKRLPPHIRIEWESGRVVPPGAVERLDKPVRVAAAGHWYEFSNEGMLFSKGNLLRVDGVSDLLARTWVIEQTGQYFIAWKEIKECVVADDSDGPDPYRLTLHQGGSFIVRRHQPEALSECGVLDLVRNVGRVPVRLRCDVACS